MVIQNREYLYRDVIRVSGPDLTAVKRGAKTCTIRLGVATVEKDDMTLSDGRRTVEVLVTQVDAGRLYRDLDISDAQEEGFESMDELDADLRQYYGAIDPNQPMTVIRFRLVNPPPSQEALF